MLIDNGSVMSRGPKENTAQNINVGNILVRRNILRQLKQVTPLEVDEFTTLLDAKIRDNHLVLIYKIVDTTKDELSGEVGEQMREEAKFSLCEEDVADLTKDYFQGYIYSYQNENEELLHSFRIQFSECDYSNLEVNSDDL